MKGIKLCAECAFYSMKKHKCMNGATDEGKATDHFYADCPLYDVVPVERVAARPLEEWHEDYGDVLWWKFPIEEPPYVGSPLDSDWSGYHTHWTPIEVPEPPNGGADMRGEEDG